MLENDKWRAPYRHQHLKLARLPIPPPGQVSWSAI